jgi:tRNA A37 threonylcarbamoyladenosine dehydratase
MMETWQSRTKLLIGPEKLEILNRSHVLVAGLGGVGGYAVEQLCRAGIGKFTLVDCDVVQPSNRNRQIVALISGEGRRKTDVIAERMKEINPGIAIDLFSEFLDERNIAKLLEGDFDYVLDAIDTLTPKVALLAEAKIKGYRIISSMGSGGKMDPSAVRISDIDNSYSCKLAYKVRKALHARNIRTGIKVVYSPEEVPQHAILKTDGSKNKRSMVGTISYMPAVFGCYCAAEIIKDLLGSIQANHNNNYNK